MNIESLNSEGKQRHDAIRQLLSQENSSSENAESAENAKSSIAQEFTELLGGLSKRAERIASSDQSKYLAGLFAAEPQSQEIARKTSQQIQKIDREDKKLIERESHAENVHGRELKQRDSDLAARDQGANKVENNAEKKVDEKDGREKQTENGKGAARTERTDGEKSGHRAEASVAQGKSNDPQGQLNVKDLIADITKQSATKVAQQPTEITLEQAVKGIAEKISVATTNTNSAPVTFNTAPSVDLTQLAPTAPVMPSVAALLNDSTKALLSNEVQNNRFAATSQVDSAQRVEAGQAKLRESFEQGDVEKKLKSQFSKKDMTQAVLKVEEALREAVKLKDGKTISLRLDPPDLGAVKIDVTVKDGSIYARVVAESSQVAAFLREKGSELQQALRRIGLDVDQVNVFVGSNSEQQKEFGHHMKQQSAGHSPALRLMTQDSIGIDQASLVKGIFGDKGLESGWIA